MVFAKIDKQTMLVVSLNIAPVSPDASMFIEVETDFDFSNTNNDYRYNESDSTFYNVGIKPEILTPLKQSVVTSPFSDTDGFFFRGQGFRGVATAGGVTKINWKVTDERYTNGVHIFLKNHTFMDKFNIDVVDIEYLYAGVLYDATYDPEGANIPWATAQPDGVKLQPFITDWNVDENFQNQKPLKSDYAAKIFAGLYLVVTYKSAGATDVAVHMNGLLHWKDPNFGV